MSYEDQNSLNDLDVAMPLDGATPQELLDAFRQLKAVVKNALLTAHLPDGRLRQGAYSDLAANSVGAAQISDGAVTAGKLDALCVTTEKLADLSVTSAKLADGSVTEDKYAAASIPAAAFKSNTIPLTALSGYVTREYLSSHASNDLLRAVTANAIADNAVVDRTIQSMSIEKLTGGSDDSFLFRVGGAWASVALSGALTYDSTTNTFVVESGLKAVIVGDVKGHLAAGGAGVAGVWNLRTLGEISDPDSIISFSANKFKLLKGKYLLRIECPASGVGKHQALLKDATNGAVLIWGTAENSPATGSQTKSVITGVFEVTDENVEHAVEHHIQNTVGSNDFGVPSGATNAAPYDGHVEVYTYGFIVKIS